MLFRSQDMRFFLFPCVIKAKYYPLVLVGFFTLLSGFNFDFEILSGIAFGYLYHRYLENRLKVTDSFALRVERSVLFKWMINTPGFIRISGTGSVLPASSIVVNVNSNRNTSNNSNNNNNNNSNSFKAFSGKGFAVGSSPDTNENSSSDNRNEEYNHDRNESGNTSVDISVDSKVGLDTSNSNTSNENRNK